MARHQKRWVAQKSMVRLEIALGRYYWLKSKRASDPNRKSIKNFFELFLESDELSSIASAGFLYRLQVQDKLIECGDLLLRTGRGQAEPMKDTRLLEQVLQ